MMKASEATPILDYCRKNLCTPDGKRICLLCGHVPVEAGEPVVVGIFIADAKHQKRLGAPPGKDRLLIYVLCGDCHELPDRNERVEEKLFAGCSVQ